MLKVRGNARTQYKEICINSYVKCRSVEDLDMKINRAVDLGKVIRIYSNGNKIVRYHFLSFLVDQNEVLGMWSDHSREPINVGESLKDQWKKAVVGV